MTELELEVEAERLHKLYRDHRRQLDDIREGKRLESLGKEIGKYYRFTKYHPIIREGYLKVTGMNGSDLIVNAVYLDPPGLCTREKATHFSMGREVNAEEFLGAWRSVLSILGKVYGQEGS